MLGRCNTSQRRLASRFDRTPIPTVPTTLSVGPDLRALDPQFIFRAVEARICACRISEILPKW